MPILRVFFWRKKKTNIICTSYTGIATSHLMTDACELENGKFQVWENPFDRIWNGIFQVVCLAMFNQYPYL